MALNSLFCADVLLATTHSRLNNVNIRWLLQIFDTCMYRMKRFDAVCRDIK